MNTRSLLSFSVGSGCIVLLAMVVLAAPIVPSKTALPDELRCLSGLKEIQLLFQDIPKPLKVQGLQMSTVETLVREMLLDEGFTIEDDPDLPVLEVSFRALTNKSIPDTIGFVVFLEVTQTVQVTRLGDENLDLPTSTLLAYELSPSRTVVDSVLDRLKFVIRKLVTFVGMVTDETVNSN